MFAIVAMIVIVTSSGARTSATSASSNVKGSMTIDGKTSELHHAYLIRQPPESVPQYGYLKVLITNEPIPKALLSKVVAEAKTLYPEFDDVFAGTSIRGLMVVTNEVPAAAGKPSYIVWMFAADTLLLSGYRGELEALAVRDGVVSGVASSEWTNPTGVLQGKERRDVRCAFRVTFEARNVED
jgi:hypothetical protein